MIHPATQTAFFMVGNTANVGSVHREVKKVIDKKLIPLLYIEKITAENNILKMEYPAHNSKERY